MAKNIVDGVTEKSPFIFLFLLKALMPIIAVIFVLSFVTLATELLCPSDILNILFDASPDYQPTKRYLALEKFIYAVKDFIYYIIEQIVNFVKYMLQDLMPNNHFGDFIRPNKCVMPL